MVRAYRRKVPFHYDGWTLYSRNVKFKNGPKVTIYFFSKRKPSSGKLVYALPRGRKVKVIKDIGLPFLARK